MGRGRVDARRLAGAGGRFVADPPLAGVDRVGQLGFDEIEIGLRLGGGCRAATGAGSAECA